MMKGYKYLDKNMEAPNVDGFFYELGKEYELENESKLEIYGCGYHFYDNIIDTLIHLYFNDDEDANIYEVEADGKILCDDGTYRLFCSSKIKIVRKLEYDEIWEMVKDIVLREKYRAIYCIPLIERGYGLDKFINDKDWLVRRAVAQQGYGLDKLINDEDVNVRVAVARQGMD